MKNVSMKVHMPKNQFVCKRQTFSSSKRKLRLMFSLFRLGFLAIQTRKTLFTIFLTMFHLNIF